MSAVDTMRHSFRYIWLPICLALATIQPAWSLPSITVSETSIASTLPLDGEDSTTTRIIKVATLNLSTDNPKGFTLTINSGRITKSLETPIEFQVTTVPANDSPPDSGSFSVPSGSNYTVSINQAGNAYRDLYIKYTPAIFQDPGTYTASISLAVADNP